MGRIKSELQEILETGADVGRRRVYLHGPVDESMAYRATTALDVLTANSSERPITVLLNTFGGDVYQGLAIYDAIRQFPGEVTIVGSGAVMSMGALLMQAGDVRQLTPRTTVMVHVGTDGFEGDSRSFWAWGAFSKKLDTTLREILAEKTGYSIKFWENKMKADVIFSAQEAVKYRLADAITE